MSLAHHPGSHAKRAGGDVVVDAVATATDSCTTVGEVALGAPAGVAPPRGSAPVTLRLVRPEGAVCAQVVSSPRSEARLRIPPEIRLLHLYVLGPDGRVTATERVPIR